ncbi:MAG: alpha/beta hydrolase-fold protein [Ferruginibacter sp.]
MKKIIFAVLFIQSFAMSVQGQDLSLYQKKWFIKDNDTLPYRLLLPLNYDASKKYPLILFLHGAGERGSDNELQLVHGSGLFLRDSVRQKYPAIVVMPQCALNSFWSNVQFKMDSTGFREFIFREGGDPTKSMELLLQLFKKIVKEYPVDKKQLYVGGLSMGGMGTFEMVRRNPGVFAAAFPICGGGATGTAAKMKDVNWWIFHGDADAVVPPKLSQEMVDALKAAGAPVKFTLYPGVNHNSWDNAFVEPDLVPWLFSNKRK